MSLCGGGYARYSRAMRKPVVLALALLAFSPAFAEEKPDARARKQEQARRCASEGPGFIYSKEADACIRVGGAVGGQYSTGSSGGAYGR